MKNGNFIIILSFLLIQTQFLLGQTNSIKQQSYTKVDSLFNNIFKSNKTGASFSLVKNGKTIYQNSKGLANIEYQLPITDSTAFHIASVSKQFTTYLALLLEEEGKLSFKDDIKNYLPELNHLQNTITIKNLTNHTHGLPNIHELAKLKGIFPKMQMNNREIVELLLNIKHANFKAGDEYQYGNTGYILLAEIIERIGKKPFKQQLKEKILLPLGMKNTKVIDDINTVIKNKAYSYETTNEKNENLPLTLATIGSSGISTTIHDLSLWAINYQNPIVGSKTFYQRMEQATYLNSNKKINYGMGLQFENYKGLDIVFHGGGDAGYRSYILHIPKNKISMVILSNSNGFSAFDMIYRAIDILMKDFIQTEPSEKLNISTKSLKKFDGTYEFHPGVYFEIATKKDSLYFRQYGSKEFYSLPYLKENTFNFPFIQYSKLTFFEDKFDLRIADFTYECKKVILKQTNPEEINSKQFIGVYRNIEFKITFELVVIKNQLILKRDIGDDIILAPFANNSFVSSKIGKLDFVFDENGQVTAFKLSGQNYRNIVFKT